MGLREFFKSFYILEVKKKFLGGKKNEYVLFSMSGDI